MLVLSYCERRDQPVNQLKEYLIWIVLGIPGMVLIGLVLHSLVHFETGVLIIASMILGTFLMVFCAALCKSAHDGDLLSEMKKAATKSNFDLDGKGKLGEENEDDCDL
jgi:hypothetical protein